MGAGIRIDYMDGTRPMEITSGLVSPSFILSIAGTFRAPSLTFNLPGRIPGSQLLVLPTSISIYYNVARVAIYNGFVDNGNSVTILMRDQLTGGSVTSAVCSLLVFQYPLGDSGLGIKLENCSDFTMISASSQCCRLLKRQKITFNREWVIPSIDGIPSHQQLIFAQWDQPGVSVSRADIPQSTNNRDALLAYPDIPNRDQNNGATVTLDLLIYGPGYLEPGNNGIRIMNGNGHCVFSTKNRPLVIDSRKPNSFNVQPCDNMVMLCSPGVYGYNSGGYTVLQDAGYVMTNGTIKLGKGRVIAEFYGSDTFRDDVSINPMTLCPPLY